MGVWASVHDEEEWRPHGRPFTTKRSGVLMGVRSRRRCRSAQDSGVGWAFFPGNITDKRSKL